MFRKSSPLPGLVSLIAESGVGRGDLGLKGVRGKAEIKEIINKNTAPPGFREQHKFESKRSYLTKQGTVHQERMPENRSVPKHENKEKVSN